MPTEILMALGTFRFSVDTAGYEDLRRTAEQRWAAQERVRQGPALQHMGPGEESIELRGNIYPHYRGGAGQVSAMRALSAQGVPQMLVDGRGMVHGWWVIERVEEGQSSLFADGVPRRQEFSLVLRRYHDAVTGAAP